MTTYAEKLAALEALYASLPKIKCQRMCYISCGPIPMTEFERGHILLVTGMLIPPPTEEWNRRWRNNEKLYCPALSANGACNVYEVRPTICRLWGAGRGQMACPHMCEVEGPRLRSEEIMDVLNRASVIVGEMSEAERLINQTLMQVPRIKALQRRLISGDNSVREELNAAMIEEASRL